jgi:hypothetical protein
VGLLTHGAGSSVIVSDPRSMQLPCVLPMPSSSLASFITVVRRAPPAAPSLAGAVAGEGEDDEDDCRPLRLTAGDHHDRIVVWDARVLHWLNLDETRGVALVSIGGVQDLCWIHHASGWLLAAINGPSLLCIWEMSNNPRVLWMFDATPETTAELEAKLDEGRRLTADKFVSTICDRVLHSNCSPVQQIDRTEPALDVVQGVAIVVDASAVPASLRTMGARRRGRRGMSPWGGWGSSPPWPAVA